MRKDTHCGATRAPSRHRQLDALTLPEVMADPAICEGILAVGDSSPDERPWNQGVRPALGRAKASTTNLAPGTKFQKLRPIGDGQDEDMFAMMA